MDPTLRPYVLMIIGALIAVGVITIIKMAKRSKNKSR